MDGSEGLTLLKIDASARHEGSETRALTALITERIGARQPALRLIERDVSQGLEFIDEAWIGANFTPEEDRSPAQRDRLATSDALVAELFAADVLVIGVPVYNFGIPAALKAWIDLVARAKTTFRYTENGPEGLLKNKKAYVALASGGTGFGSEIDFASGYVRHVLSFLGITDVTFFASDRLMVDETQSKTASRAAIDAALGAPALA